MGFMIWFQRPTTSNGDILLKDGRLAMAVARGELDVRHLRG